MKLKERLLSLLLAAVMVFGLVPAISAPAQAAEASRDIYEADYMVTLPADGMVAEVIYQEGSEKKIKEYKLDGTEATRKAVNQQLTNAWRFALDQSRDGDLLPETDLYRRRVEMHIFVDWIAVKGYFNPDKSDDGFDGGEIEVDGIVNSSILLDLHGHTLDRGSDTSHQYGRVFDIDNEDFNVTIVSTEVDNYGVVNADTPKGVITGGWDEYGGAIRVDDGCGMYLRNLHLKDNCGLQGGAVYINAGGEFIATDCLFSGNIAESHGGAITNESVIVSSSVYLVSNCGFYFNESQGHGGAVCIWNTPHLMNKFSDCIFYGNRSDREGGAIFVECDSCLTIDGDSRIYGNHALGEGGGIFLEAYANDEAHLTLGGTASVYSNTMGANPTASNIHLDTGITSAGNLRLADGFRPIRPIGIRAEENGQTVAKFSNGDDFTQALVNEYFFSDRTDQRIVADEDKAKAEKLSSSTAVGSLTQFSATVTAPDGFAGLDHSSVIINNDTNTVELRFPSLPESDFSVSVNAEATDGSVIDLGGDLLSFAFSEGRYTAYFKIWNSGETAYDYWTVNAKQEDNLDANLAMTVSYSDTTERFSINPSDISYDPFQAGWNFAISKIRDSVSVTVTLYRDWMATNGSFGEDKSDYSDGFDDGRIAVSGETSGSTYVSECGRVTLDLNGHTIDRGLTEATENGQVFCVNGGTNLIITDSSAQGGATITGGYCEGNGGAIYAKSSFDLAKESDLVIENVTITGNHCTGKGGGIYWEVGGKLQLRDAVITGNTAGNAGGGVYASSSGSDPYVGGVLRITGNTADGKTDNLCLEDEQANLNHDTGYPLAAGASIGVNMASGFGSDGKDCISADGSKFRADSSQYFFSDVADYVIMADDEGSGSNKYRLHLAKADDDNFADSRCAITDISFGTAGEYVTISESDHSVTVTVDANLFVVCSNTYPTLFTVTDGSSVSPAVNTARDYTQPQSFVLTAPDGITKQTWTVQVVPKGGEWAQYELKVHGGTADRYTYYPDEIVTIIADDRTGAEFKYWQIKDDINGTRTTKSPKISFIMPAAEVVADAIYNDLITRVEVNMTGMDVGGEFSNVVFTAAHDVGEGIFKSVESVWYDSGTVVSNSATIEPNTTYGLSLVLEPNGEMTFSDNITCTINGTKIVCTVAHGVIYVDTCVTTGNAEYAVITVKDQNGNTFPSYRYSLTKDGQLVEGERAAFLPDERYYDADQDKSFELVSVSGITDGDPLAEGWQFTVTDHTDIVVTYRELNTVSTVTVTLPTVTPGQALPTTMILSTGAELVSLTWEPADDQAEYCGYYSATAVVKPADGYVFDSLVTVNLDADLDGDGSNDSNLYTTWMDGTVTFYFSVTTDADLLTGVTPPKAITIPRGGALTLPEMVAVTTEGGSIHAAEVIWEEPDGFSTDVPGNYTFTGELCLPYFVELGTGMTGEIELTVTIHDSSVSKQQVEPPGAIIGVEGGVDGNNYYGEVLIGFFSGTGGARSITPMTAPNPSTAMAILPPT